MGRPSGFREEFVEQARKLALLGATDKEMADIWGVSEQTVNAWKNKHPKFFEALKDGKEKADAEVGQRLYERACGYEHDDVHISTHNGSVTMTPIRKRYPPDTTACIFWLKNRQKANWRDKQHTELSADESVARLFEIVAQASKKVTPNDPR